MSHELFTDVVRPSVSLGTNRWRSVPVSIVTHLIVVAALVIMPFTAVGVFPTPESVLAFSAAPPPPRPVPVVMQQPIPSARSADIPLRVTAEPSQAPSTVAERPPTIWTTTSGVDTLPVAGPPFAVFNPPPAETRPATIPDPLAPPVRVGGAIGEPRRVHYVAPVFPAVARASRSEGLVILEVVVTRNGDVRDANVLRSHPMFDRAAIDAVRQWRYTPTTLNGTPVDVTMTVTVRFSLH
jgi:TonB family protein